VFDTLYFKFYDAVTWKYLVPYVPTDPDALVLDAGGGTGRWATGIADKGCRVVLAFLKRITKDLAQGEAPSAYIN
jgi:ubiquinone/menaquinone biosynthesis C-methylase UbiE